MGRGAYARRIDENQNEIVKVFRKLGASVLLLSSVGRGCPDICVGITDHKGHRHNLLLEIKDGNKYASQCQLTQHESKFFETWKGQVNIVSTIDEAIHVFNHVKRGYPLFVEEPNNAMMSG